MNSLRVKTYNLLPIEGNYYCETRAKVHFWSVSLEFWTPYYAFKMCPIFCSFPNFGLIRKIPLSLVAQLVSFTEKNVDPPSGLGKNYDKQLCTQILGVEFPFNPMSWQYSWKAWKVPYNLLNCPILGLFSFSPTCFQCRMLLPILLTSHSVWKYLKKVAFFNIQHFCWDVFFSVNCNCHATYFIDFVYLVRVLHFCW